MLRSRFDPDRRSLVQVESSLAIDGGSGGSHESESVGTISP